MTAILIIILLCALAAYLYGVWLLIGCIRQAL
jgi:hypothetical protein